MTKQELRNILKIKRRYFGEVLKTHADGCILDNFLAGFGDKDSYFIYSSLPAEADTKGIIRALCVQNKRILLPRIEGENMVAVPYEEGAKTYKSRFGTEEVEGQAVRNPADITVIPLLCVNGRGYRIGYGGGYYDRYLKDCKTVKVGLGYYFQMCEFEEEGHDIPLDYFVCERGIYDFGKRGI